MKPWLVFLLSIKGAILFFGLAAIIAVLIYRMNVKKKKREKKQDS